MAASHPSHRLLWLLRHAKTKRRPPAGGTDHERELSRPGHEEAVALSARLGDSGDHLGVARDEFPDLVLCSTAARAVQTAELVLAEMKAPPPVSFRGEFYQASPQEVIAQLQLVSDEVRAVMIVGHNPTFEELANALPRTDDVAGHEKLEERGVPTCALGFYDLEVRRWQEVEAGKATLRELFVPPF